MVLVLFVADDVAPVIRQVPLVTRFADDGYFDVLSDVVSGRYAACRAGVGPSLQVLQLNVVDHPLLALVEGDVGDRVRRRRSAATLPCVSAATAECAQVASGLLVCELLLRTHRREKRTEDGAEPCLDEREDHG